MRQMKNSGIEWVGKIPNDWELIKIKYILQERIEKNSPIKTKNILSLTAHQGVIPIAEREGGGNKPKEDFSDYKLAYPGDIVMNSMNILSGSVGLSQYYGCVSPVYYMLRPLNKNFDVRFFNYIFQSTVFQKSLYGLGNGILMKESGNGKLNTIRMRIPMEKFGGLYIPLAPASEQKAIAEFLDKKCGEVDALIADIQQEIETLEQYKRSVITEAVTRGLDPSVPMKESGIDWLGEIPMLWETKRIAAFYQLRNEKVSDKDFPPLSVTKQGVLPQLETVAKTDDGDNRKLVRKGDFAINSRSDRRGSCGISDYDGSVSLINIVLKPRDKANNKYYNWLFHTEQFADEFYKWGNGIVDDLWTTRWQNMKKIIIPVPPIENQQKIADYLDKKCKEIEEIITEKQSQIETLESYKKSLIYEYVTGKKQVS